MKLNKIIELNGKKFKVISKKEYFDLPNKEGMAIHDDYNKKRYYLKKADKINWIKEKYQI